jgi:hypothetical protein
MRGRSWTRLAGLLVALLVLAVGAVRAAETDMGPDAGPSDEAAAVLDAVSGVVEVLRAGEWLAGEEGAELALEDQVRTDADSFARVRFLDDDPDAGAEATIVDLSPDTTVVIEELSIERDDQGAQRTGIVGMLRGVINTITKGWGSGSLFSVRAGTTVCGIRGSVANVGYDPEAGEATVTSLDGEMYTFEAKDRRDALARTRAAMRDLRRNRRASFLQGLTPGEQMFRGRKGPFQRRKVALERFQAARKAALDSRRAGFAKARNHLAQFAKVRPPKRRPGRLAKKRIERRIQRFDNRKLRIPTGVRKPIRNRMQDARKRLQDIRDRRQEGGSLRDRLQRKAPEKQGSRNGTLKNKLKSTQDRIQNKRKQNRQMRRRRRMLRRRR